MKKRTLLSALAVTSVLALSACGGGGGNPLEGGGNNSGSSGSQVIVGSADFTESQLIASLYSQALQSAGVSVKEQFNIGSREVYIAALKDGSIDLVPEYVGSGLGYYDKKATTGDGQQNHDKLQAIRDGDEAAMRDLARLAIAAFGRRGEGSGVLGVDVQRIRRALGLRSDPGGPVQDTAPGEPLTREQIRRFEAHLRRELERAQIERTQSLPPSRPLTELDRALPTGPLQDLAAVHRVVAQLKRRLATLRVLENHAQRLPPIVGIQSFVVLNEVVLLQDLGDLHLQLRDRHVHAAVLRPTGVANAREHIGYRICHAH